MAAYTTTILNSNSDPVVMVAFTSDGVEVVPASVDTDPGAVDFYDQLFASRINLWKTENPGRTPNAHNVLEACLRNNLILNNGYFEHATDNEAMDEIYTFANRIDKVAQLGE